MRAPDPAVLQLEPVVDAAVAPATSSFEEEANDGSIKLGPIVLGTAGMQRLFRIRQARRTGGACASGTVSGRRCSAFDRPQAH